MSPLARLKAARPWRTLGLRLMLISLVVEVTMLTALMVSNTRVMERAIAQQFDTRMAELANLLEASLAPALVQRDYGMLQDVLDALRTHRGIDYLVLRDYRGRVMAASGWPEGQELPPLSAGPASEAKGRYDTSVAIGVGGQSYGELRLGISTAIFAESRRSLLASGLVIAAAEVLLSAAVLITVGIWLTRRLSALTRASEAIAQGELSTRVPLGRRREDEVNRLAHSFNTMAETLQLRVEQIADSEHRFRSLFNGSPVALLELDFSAVPRALEGLAEQGVADAAAHLGAHPDLAAALLRQIRVASVNDAALRLYQAADREALLARFGAEAVPPGVAADDLAAFARGQLRSESDGAITTLTGQRRLVTVSRSLPPGGEPILLVSLIDVTETRTAQHALSERTAALERSNAELEQFAYVASHDLREPLRMVSNFLSLLERRYAERLDQDAKDYIGFAREGAVRMDRLVLDLLDFSRVGRVDALMAMHDSGALIRRALDNLGPAIAEAGAEITLPEQLPTLYCNDNELMRLFQNLIGNAIKFRDDQRPLVVTISCERAGSHWQFSVADNGIGIAAEYFDKLFRIFQRLHPRERYDGTGIGLAICKRIVERHGGRIWLNSTPGQGSTFVFTLPAEGAPG